MDDTFKLTAYCLRLASVIVVDEWDRGIPAAYLLSNRMSEDEVALMFKEVKALLPEFDTHFFMSDDCNSFYNGFIRIFPYTKAQKLLCSFHIIQAIKRNSRVKLKQKNLAESVVVAVRRLCKTSNPNDFESKYQDLLSFLEWTGRKRYDRVFGRKRGTLSDRQFARVLCPQFSFRGSRIQQWGGFARKNACVGTSMPTERFQKRPEHKFLRRKEIQG
ncbi:hypothetical protein COOONC_04272 [Cooperia oncophora]